MDMPVKKSLRVNSYTGGLVGPSQTMLGPVADGGTIVAETAPGCWGPMITPSFRGGHEVTQPIAVAGADVGDAIAIRIRKVRVTSTATASGTMSFVDGRYTGDPFVARHCPGCGTKNPPTRLEGIGREAVRCAKCGAEASPFRLDNGYTIVFDEERKLAVTVEPKVAEALAKDARKVMALPQESKQNPIVAWAPAEVAGVVTRLRPFIGNIGTTPSIDMPDSHNAGDFGTFLLDAPHEYGISRERLDECRTDGHLDLDSVREGAILICPVKVAGGGIYVGDAHAMQGDGEIAGHTTDVSAEITLQVSVIKGLKLGGPVLLPPAEDLPHLARPFSADEKRRARQLADKFGQGKLDDSAPIQMVGSGATINEAVDNGVARLAALLAYSKDEVLNRVTLTGAVEIGRLPGMVAVTMLVPMERLEKAGLADLVREQYGG
ncbi:MAG TPA: acetamidase/formamidase family protein [Burkholderiales bacterium]